MANDFSKLKAVGLTPFKPCRKPYSSRSIVMRWAVKGLTPRCKRILNLLKQTPSLLRRLDAFWKVAPVAAFRTDFTGPMRPVINDDLNLLAH